MHYNLTELTSSQKVLLQEWRKPMRKSSLWSEYVMQLWDVSAVTTFAFTKQPLIEGVCVLALGSHKENYWVLSELCQNKFPLKVSKQSMESFCYTLLNSPNKWQNSLSLREKGLSACIYCGWCATNTRQKRKCGPSSNSNAVFRVLLFSLHVRANGSKRESHKSFNHTWHDVTDVLQDIGHSKILAFWNLRIKLVFLGGINLTQNCVGAHKQQTYSYLLLITCVFKHAKLSALLFPFNWVYFKIWLSISKVKYILHFKNKTLIRWKICADLDQWPCEDHLLWWQYCHFWNFCLKALLHSFWF